MDIYFLEAAVPLTKAYTKSSTGQLTKTPYPMTWEFTSHARKLSTLTALHQDLMKHAALGHCLLKGPISKPLVKESRAGSTNTNDATEFIVLDLDGLPDTFMLPDATGVEHKVAVTLDSFLKAIGLDQISHIVQWSASYGIENTKLRAHVFFMLDKPMVAPLLKQWLIQLNHQTSMLNAAMGLTSTGNSISWALDISACQNDKLIYIAPPILKGIKDPLPKGRITLNKRKLDKVSVIGQINSHAKNQELTHKRIGELRELANLPKKKIAFKMHGSVEVMVKPDSATITDMKQERGFVYFNLNGGDSWAYYHPESNPDYIFNFKGEPAYLTKDLLPDYWNDLTKVGARANSSGLTYLAFCDRATSSYYRGTYDTVTDELALTHAKNETIVRHFAQQNGLPLGKFIPEWNLTFDPKDNVRVDFANMTVNEFQLTEYMKATARQVKQCPKTIYRVINHALGDDAPITEHFINWLAFILRERDRTKTAWVLHGTTGTGKGVLFANILRPIFGVKQTAGQNMQGLGEQYNHWMRQSLIVFVDEVQTKALMNEQGVIAKLKNYITEKFVPIREMYKGTQECRNYTNWILASNKPDPITIDAEDRRMNVAKYQPNKLVLTDADMEKIASELQAFHDYLLYYPVDNAKAGTVMSTTDRQTMISISESSVDTVGNAILEGRFGFLMEQLPSSTTNTASNVKLFNETEDYKQVLINLLSPTRTDRNNGKCNISRDELKTIFNYVVGGMPTTPNKFTSLLKHHRIHMQDVWINNGSTAGKERGIPTYWKDLADFPKYQAVFTPPVVKSTKATKKKLAAVI